VKLTCGHCLSLLRFAHHELEERMSTFANQLKSEISRLAKKEVRVETKSLKKSSTQHRSDIAALKRQIAQLQAEIKRLKKGKRGAAVQAEEAGDDSPRLRFRPAGFAKLREKLGLSALDMGKLLGVSMQSVYHWEQGKSRPRASQLAAIAAARKLGKREVAQKLAE
jgi:DNA-binding transcriptional regulator YiaG